MTMCETCYAIIESGREIAHEMWHYDLIASIHDLIRDEIREARA